MSEANKLRPLIPSWLDDMGLSARQFRVFCHLSRRAGVDGDCHPAMSSIIEKCQISENTGWKILKELEALGLIVRGKRARNSNRYLVANERPIPTPPKEKVQTDTPKSDEWPTVKSRRSQPPQSDGEQSPQSSGRQSPQSKGRKGAKEFQ